MSQITHRRAHPESSTILLSETMHVGKTLSESTNASNTVASLSAESPILQILASPLSFPHCVMSCHAENPSEQKHLNVQNPKI